MMEMSPLQDSNFIINNLKKVKAIGLYFMLLFIYVGYSLQC